MIGTENDDGNYQEGRGHHTVWEAIKIVVRVSMTYIISFRRNTMESREPKL